MPSKYIYDYINIFYTQLINGVNIFVFTTCLLNNYNIIFKMNQRYQATLQNDPDLYLTIGLTNVLIITVNNNYYYLYKKLNLLRKLFIGLNSYTMD